MNWKYVKLEDTIRCFDVLIKWELDHIPEEYFMYKWTIEEVVKAYDDAKEAEKTGK
jgi:F0F1-type ATP synthase beta subunit